MVLEVAGILQSYGVKLGRCHPKTQRLVPDIKGTVTATVLTEEGLRQAVSVGLYRFVVKVVCGMFHVK